MMGRLSHVSLSNRELQVFRLTGEGLDVTRFLLGNGKHQCGAWDASHTSAGAPFQ
jgi:hypothetical protein